MRIRSGFVSNSSSTSFLIISEEDLTLEHFLKVAGVGSMSPLREIFEELFLSLTHRSRHVIDFAKTPSKEAMRGFIEAPYYPMSNRMIERVEEARKNGLKVFYGELSSEENSVETFFCCDSFEIDGDGIYVDALKAVW